MHVAAERVEPLRRTGGVRPLPMPGIRAAAGKQEGRPAARRYGVRRRVAENIDVAVTALPAVAQVHDGAQPQRYDVRLSGGRVIVPLSGGACSLRIEMATAQPRG